MIDFKSAANDRRYGISYSTLRQEYLRFCEMSDADFRANLPQAIHLACIIAWFKEIGNDFTLGDGGLIHELAHLLAIPDEPLVDFTEIRKQFAQTLNLAP